MALIPILSDARGVQLLVRKWEKKGRLPDAIVIEHPRLAGGHLGAAKVSDLNDRRFDFDVVLPEVLEFFRKTGLSIPLIAAGGISSREDVRHLQALGAAAVQLGTAFAVTVESDASLAFKEVLAGAQARGHGRVHQRRRPAGARRAHPGWTSTCACRTACRRPPTSRPIAPCGSTAWPTAACATATPSWGQFCIDKVLGHALAGDVRKGYSSGCGPPALRQPDPPGA